MNFYFKALENVDQINWKRTCAALFFCLCMKCLQESEKDYLE